MSSMMTKNSGTAAYMAPEVFIIIHSYILNLL